MGGEAGYGPVAMELLRVLVLVLAGLCAATSVLGLMGAFSGALDILTHFAPVTLTAGLAALVLGLATGVGAPGLTLSLVAIGGCLVLIVPEFLAGRGRRRDLGGGQRLKVVQFNLWARNVDPRATLAWIEAEDADIVVLQEVERASRGAPAALARFYPHRVPEVVFASSAVILAKVAPSDQGLLFSTAAGRRTAAAWASFGEGESRFTVVGAHLAWPTTPRLQQAQLRRLAEGLARFDPRTAILTGDFNLTPWSFALRRLDARLGLKRRTRAMATWPARDIGHFPSSLPFAFLPIDHVYAGGDWKTVEVRRGPRLGSDHFPLVVTLARAEIPGGS